MIVYADVLIFLNTLVDYFLLLVTAKLTGEKTKTLRVVLAAFLGGISSLYIFLPRQKIVIEFIYKVAVAFLLSWVCFGVTAYKKFVKNTGVFFLATCGYAGVMFALWAIFKPYGMVINNSVVYLSISPTVLVLFSIGGYVAFTLLWQIFKKSSTEATRHEITVFANDKQICLNAIADTGNSLEDVFGKSEVIIADERQAIRLFGNLEIEHSPELARRYRLLPCSTVSGTDTLKGYRCDTAQIKLGDGKIILHNPILAVSKTPLNDDYNAIINPKILR